MNQTVDLLTSKCTMGKFSISTGKNGVLNQLMTKRSEKVDPVFFDYKFWQDELSDFLRKEDSN